MAERIYDSVARGRHPSKSAGSEPGIANAPGRDRGARRDRSRRARPRAAKAHERARVRRRRRGLHVRRGGVPGDASRDTPRLLGSWPTRRTGRSTTCAPFATTSASGPISSFASSTPKRPSRPGRGSRARRRATLRARTTFGPSGARATVSAWSSVMIRERAARIRLGQRFLDPLGQSLGLDGQRGAPEREPLERRRPDAVHRVRRSRTTRDASSTIRSTSARRSPGRTIVSRPAAANPPHVSAASSIRARASSSGYSRQPLLPAERAVPTCAATTPLASASAVPRPSRR